MAGCASGASGPPDGAGTTRGVILPATSDVFRFDAFPEMVATADGVVVARVVDMRPSPTLTTDAGPYRQWLVHLELDDVVYGSGVEPALDLVVDEVFINPQLEAAGRAWWRAGTRVVVFLYRWDDGLLRPLNSHSVYIVAGTDLRPVYDGGLAGTIGGWSLDELRAKTAEAAALVAAGAVTPQPMRLPGQAP